MKIKAKTAIFLMLALTALPTLSNECNNDDVHTEAFARKKIADEVEKLKLGVRERNIDLLSEIINFPFIVHTRDSNSDQADDSKKTKLVINSKEELAQNFEKIFKPAHKQFVECLTADNLTFKEYYGFFAATGAIHFEDIVVDGCRKYALTVIHSSPDLFYKWMEDNNCYNTNPTP